MPINFERLDAAITYAAEHPAEFAMEFWFERTPGCGTTACLAGTAATQAGWQPVFEEDDEADLADTVRLGDREQLVESVATELLGLSWRQGLRMFSASDLDHVIRIRNEWAAEAGVPERTWAGAI